MKSNEERDEFLNYQKMVRDFNEYGVNGVKPEYRIDEEYIYDLRHETKTIFDIVTNSEIEVLMDTNERKESLANYAKEFFNITLSQRLTIPEMLEKLFEGVIELNGMFTNDYRQEHDTRMNGYSSGDLVYALSLMNDEDVAEGEPPNFVAIEAIKEVMEYKNKSDDDDMNLITELDEETIERILDKDFIIGV